MIDCSKCHTPFTRTTKSHDHWCPQCRCEYNKQYNKQHKTQRQILNATQHSKLKLEVLQHVSGLTIPQCKCGFKDIRALSIDHINGNGNIHRKTAVSSCGNIIYRWLKQNNYPSGFQVLCMNCQFIKKTEDREI